MEGMFGGSILKYIPDVNHLSPDYKKNPKVFPWSGPVETGSTITGSGVPGPPVRPLDARQREFDGEVFYGF